MDNMSYLSSEEDDGDEDDDETEESSCESDDDSSSQQTSNMFTPHSDRIEEVCLGSERLTLPQGLCENQEIFNEFFSLDTWNNVLSNEQREHLKQFLPSFPQNEEKEQEETINNLFSRSNFKFGNPLSKLCSDLHNGYLRPDIAKMRTLMKRTQYREYRYWHRRYCYKNMQSLLVSRRRLMKAALNNPPDVAPKVERVVLPPALSQSEQRARRRYFEELVIIRKSQGESSQSSDDENYPEGPPPKLSKKQKKQLSTMETCLSPDLPPIPSTLTSTASPFQLEAQVTCTFNPYEITEDSYKTLLMRHKKRRLLGEEHPDLNVKGIILQDVAQRSQTSRRTPNKQPGSQSDSQPRAKKKIKDSCSIGFSEMPDMDVLDKPVTPTRVPVVQRRKSTNNVSILQPPTLHIKEEALDEDDILPMALPQQQQNLIQLKQHNFTKQPPSSPQQQNIKFQQIQKPIRKQSPKAIPQKPPQPTQHTQKPLQQTSKPIQSIQKPIQQIQKPIQQIQKPIQQIQKPLQQIQKPLQQIQKPLQQIQKSLQQQQQQLHQAIQVQQQQQQTPVVQLKEKLEEKAKEMPKQTPILVSRAPTVMVSSASLTTSSAQSFRPLSAVDIITKVTANSLAELELTQETHVCFLSLVRDVICSTPDQRMGLPALEQKLRAWQESPISPLNDWYSLAPSWVALLPSAVNFLSGDFPPETQPEDFVPYLEYKPHMQAYQWIGAGRDSDHHLAPLCTHWLERRNEVPTVPVRDEEQVEEPGLASPPPARCPTTWQVRKAEGTERENFHQQEKRRYENPHRAFTYRMHGYESVVGPVKGACTLGTGLTKPRGHTLLVQDRPNYVTILSLVRDAVARLPNGEGSRSDICELLRDSQYLVTGSEENYLQSVVGGALDRLHFEIDTCVKYDAKRKTWVYLHRNRSEEEFEDTTTSQDSNQPRKRGTRKGNQALASGDHYSVATIWAITRTDQLAYCFTYSPYGCGPRQSIACGFIGAQNFHSVWWSAKPTGGYEQWHSNHSSIRFFYCGWRNITSNYLS
ncbi:hypothetical protein B566_EDAN007930 [Ephemera danica]|nr:hypothetical protein B566_EDAN007930 [Ephemera danica]